METRIVFRVVGTVHIQASEVHLSRSRTHSKPGFEWVLFHTPLKGYSRARASSGRGSGVFAMVVAAVQLLGSLSLVDSSGFFVFLLGVLVTSTVLIENAGSASSGTGQ